MREKSLKTKQNSYLCSVRSIYCRYCARLELVLHRNMVDPNELLRNGSARLQNKFQAAKRALKSRETFVRWLETDETAHGRTEERTIWKNEDLDLTPRKAWSWGWYDYAAFWWSYGFSTGVWSVGSSMVAMGLNAWQGNGPNVPTSRAQLTVNSNCMRLSFASSWCHRHCLALTCRCEVALRFPC
jgi:hypothetical protein